MTKKNKTLMSGNEAIARGAWEAGVRAGTGYPGTPSTEILENLCRYDNVTCEWSVNEKVALEVGLGASYAGARALVTMKHVGLNVAADVLFTAVYTGVKGGLVIVSADDPNLHSSQNEQDNRHYARAAKLPMLEPADSQEAKDFTTMAFDISERFDTPVLLRPVTRISHSMSPVELGERTEYPVEGFKRDFKKYVMIPLFARERHKVVEARLKEIEPAIASLGVNRVENLPEVHTTTGIVTAGICYTYVKEIFPDAPVFKLGMVFPLPEWELLEFCSNFDEVIVVEELEPFIEDYLKARGVKTQGKNRLPVTGEYSPEMLKAAFGSKSAANPVPQLPYPLPPRPPGLCPGCPHRTVYELLNTLGATVSGDIGCYSLGVLPPFSAMDTLVDMGAGITLAQGMEIATGKEHLPRTVAVIGDSTFAHSGVTGLMNAAYNRRNTLIIVLDNGTTAMTGMQPNPLSGDDIYGNPAPALDYRKLGEAVGLKDENIKIVDAYNRDEVESTLKELMVRNELSLLVVKGPCLINHRKKKKVKKADGAI
jgi:indolepyruvate ferredoxin oxidoreductase alpha subunit